MHQIELKFTDNICLTFSTKNLSLVINLGRIYVFFFMNFPVSVFFKLVCPKRLPSGIADMIEIVLPIIEYTYRVFCLLKYSLKLKYMCDSNEFFLFIYL